MNPLDMDPQNSSGVRTAGTDKFSVYIMIMVMPNNHMTLKGLTLSAVFLKYSSILYRAG